MRQGRRVEDVYDVYYGSEETTRVVYIFSEGGAEVKLTVTVTES